MSAALVTVMIAGSKVIRASKPPKLTVFEMVREIVTVSPGARVTSAGESAIWVLAIARADETGVA